MHAINRKDNKQLILTTFFVYTQCQEAQNVFFSALLKKPNEMAIIGPACSTVSDSIAQTAYHYQIPMVQCHSSTCM